MSDDMSLIVPLGLWEWNHTGLVLDPALVEWIEKNLSQPPRFTVIPKGDVHVRVTFGNASDLVQFLIRWA
jgi:hypothetical protein